MSYNGKAFLIILLIIILEGAIRKWILSSVGIPLMALRDLIIIIFIAIGIKKRYLNFRNTSEFILLIWSFVVFIWSYIHFMIGLIPMQVMFLTFHFWILYIWFAVLMFRTLTDYDIKIILKLLIFSIVPMVILAVTQFLSPVESFINKQVDSLDGEGVFLLAAGIVRATGTFSFTMGYTTYLALLSPLVLWMMSSGSHFIKNELLRKIIIILFFLGVIVSGSRGAIFLTFGMFGFYLVVLLISGGFKKIKTQTIVASLFLLSTLVYFAYPFLELAYEANSLRMESASEQENVSQRIVDTFIGNQETWDNFSLLGKGIGGGSSAARSFMQTSEENFIMGEMEIDRILTEAGILGILFVFLKIFISIFGITKSYTILIKEKNTLPFLFWIYLTVQLLTTSTTGQITVHAFTILSLAIGLVLIRPNIYKNLLIDVVNKKREYNA